MQKRASNLFRSTAFHVLGRPTVSSRPLRISSAAHRTTWEPEVLKGNGAMFAGAGPRLIELFVKATS